MTKKLIKNGAIYTIGDFINVAVSGFLLLPFYTRVLTQSEFGMFNVLNASIAIVTFIVHFGIISTYSRLYFNYTDEHKSVLTGQVILLHALMSLVLMLFVVMFQKVLQTNLFSTVDNTVYFYYIFIVSILSFINALYGIYLRVNEEATKFLVFQLSQVILYVSFIFIFKEFTQNTLDAILLASFASTFLIWVYSISKLKFTFCLDKFKQTVKKVLHFALPIFVGYVMYFLLNKFNVLYLQHHETIENIALFSFALQLSMVLQIFAGSFGKAVQPMLFKLNKDELVSKSKQIALFYKVVLTVILILFYVFSENIILLFATESYTESNQVFLLLLLGVYAYNFRSVESFLFMYFHKPRYSLYIVSISAFVVVVLSFILVKQYGFIGSGYAILASSIIAYFANKYFSFKMIRIEYDKKN